MYSRSVKAIRPEIIDELKIVIVVGDNLGVQASHREESNIQVIICTGYVFQLLGEDFVIMAENDPRPLQSVKGVRDVFSSYNEGVIAHAHHISSTDTA